MGKVDSASHLLSSVTFPGQVLPEVATRQDAGLIGSAACKACLHKSRLMQVAGWLPGLQVYGTGSHKSHRGTSAVDGYLICCFGGTKGRECLTPPD